MRESRRTAGSTRSMVSAGLAVALAIGITGCSLDTVIWGVDGAAVIAATDAVIIAARTGEAEALACEDGVADFGEPADWTGLEPGEPERYTGTYWKEQAPLDPDWSINLEMGVPEGGGSVPGDLFFRDTEDGLCVVDLVWATVIEVG
ncbi:hypothetical protein LG299_04305 [Microbacterium lacus]|uniref:hypothetical protein n=1 Tax=Microbacterium lacus TaxID=415217 RepID=UPI003850843D